jgi:hypothetical protein
MAPSHYSSFKHGASKIFPLGTDATVRKRNKIHSRIVNTEYMAPQTRKNVTSRTLYSATVKIAYTPCHKLRQVDQQRSDLPRLTLGKIILQKESPNEIRVLRRTCWIPNSPYTTHIVEKAQSTKLKQTHTTKTTSPACSLPRNGDILPGIGRASFMNLPIIRTENPACPKGPTGTKEDTMLEPGGKPCRIRRLK